MKQSGSSVLDSRHVVLSKTEPEDIVIAISSNQIGEVAVCPLLKPRKSLMKFDFAHVVHPIFQAAFQVVCELERVTFEVAKARDDVELSNGSIQLSSIAAGELGALRDCVVLGNGSSIKGCLNHLLASE